MQGETTKLRETNHAVRWRGEALAYWSRGVEEEQHKIGVELVGDWNEDAPEGGEKVNVLGRLAKLDADLVGGQVLRVLLVEGNQQVSEITNRSIINRSSY